MDSSFGFVCAPAITGAMQRGDLRLAAPEGAGAVAGGRIVLGQRTDGALLAITCLAARLQQQIAMLTAMWYDCIT